MYVLAGYLFLVSLVLSIVLTRLAIPAGRRWGVLDQPGPLKIHSVEIPLSGGWAIFATLTLVFWGHLFGALLVRGTSLEGLFPESMREFVSLTPSLIRKIAPLYLGAAAIFVLGLVDDTRRLSVRCRLLIQCVVASGLALCGLHPHLGFLPGWVAPLVGIVWIVGITNAFNFLDGLDGLSTGVALVGAVALLTIMGLKDQPDVMFYLSALAGTQLGFLRYNVHPARLFLGSSGSLLLGYLLAMSTLLVTYMKGSTGNWLMPLLTPVFILAIPIYDTTSVVLIRLLHKRSITIGDQNHFHHRLMRLGFSHRQTVAFIVLIAFSVALSGVRLVQATLGQSLLIVLQIAGIFSILVLAERVAAKARKEILERKTNGDPLVLSQTSAQDDSR